MSRKKGRSSWLVILLAIFGTILYVEPCSRYSGIPPIGNLEESVAVMLVLFGIGGIGSEEMPGTEENRII